MLGKKKLYKSVIWKKGLFLHRGCTWAWILLCKVYFMRTLICYYWLILPVRKFVIMNYGHIACKCKTMFSLLYKLNGKANHCNEKCDGNMELSVRDPFSPRSTHCFLSSDWWNEESQPLTLYWSLRLDPTILHNRQINNETEFEVLLFKNNVCKNVWYMHTCMCRHMYLYVCTPCHSSCPFEAGSLIGPGPHQLSRLAVNQPPVILLFFSASQCWDFRSVPPCPAFNQGSGIWTQALILEQQALYLGLSPWSWN